MLQRLVSRRKMAMGVEWECSPFFGIWTPGPQVMTLSGDNLSGAASVEEIFHCGWICDLKVSATSSFISLFHPWSSRCELSAFCSCYQAVSIIWALTKVYAQINSFFSISCIGHGATYRVFITVINIINIMAYKIILTSHISARI